jgi:PAS domain S-box-containing protein
MTTPKLGRLLIVDDENEVTSALCETLAQQGYEPMAFTSGPEALAALTTQDFEVLLIDLVMPSMDGIALLQAGLKIDQNLVGIIMTGQGTVQRAADAMKIGAYDYVLKPFKLTKLMSVLHRACDFRRMRLENVQLRDSLAIYELSKAIAFTLDEETLLNKVADAALQQFQGDELSIMLPSPAGSELYIALLRGEQRPHILGQRMPVDRGIAGWVARHKEPLLLSGNVDDPRFSPLYPRPDIQASMCYPLMVGGKMLGILNINATRSRSFSLGQFQALNILASTTASALESSALYQQVRAAEEKYRSLFENAIEGIFQFTRDGRLLIVNPALARILGYGSPEALVRTVSNIERQLYVKANHHTELMRLCDEQGRAQGFETQFYRKDGETIWVSVNARAVLYESNLSPYYEGTIEDISEHKRVEIELRASEERYRLMFESNPQPMWVYDLETTAFLAVNDAAIRHYGYTREEFLQMTIKDIRPLEDIPRLIDAMPEASLTGSSGVWRHRKKDGALIDIEITSAVLKFAGREARHVLANDVTERKRAEEAVRRNAERAEALARVAHRLNAQLDLEAVLTAVCEETTGALNVPAAFVLLYDDKRGLLKYVGGIGMPAGQAGRIKPLPRSLYEEDIQSKHLVRVVSDVRPISGWLDTELLAAANLRTVASAIMLREEQLVGILTISTIGEARQFRKDELALLKGLADQAAQAITNARLFEETNRHLQQVQALRNIDSAITASLDLRLTLNILVGEVISQLGVHAATVLLLNSSTQTLECAAARGFSSQAIEQSSIRLGEGHAGKAALDRRTVLIPNIAETDEDSIRAPLLKAEGLTAYFGVPLIAKGQVKGVLEVFHRTLLDPGQEWLDFLETLAGQAAIAIDNATLFNDLQRSNVDLTMAYDTTLEGWSRALDLRDKETEGHTLRVTETTLGLARALGMSQSEMVHVRRGALLHDIGKMGVPESILLKPGPLTEDEWVIMRLHPVYAYDLLSPIAYLRPALDIPYCHHEKWDGTGYPRGLKGEQIPLVASIFAVVDVWDALRSDRPYRLAWPEERVREHIRSLAGTHFDPTVVAKFLELI